MINPSSNIEHIGLVSDIRDNILKVRLIDQENCSACRLKNLCGMADTEKNLFEIPNNNNEYKVGDEVLLQIMPSTGFKAIFWGYLAPFLLIIAVLFLAVSFKASELYAGLIALGVLPLYYIMLALFRQKLRKHVHIDIALR